MTLVLIEMTWIDISFAIFYNLVTDYHIDDPQTHMIGKIGSVVLLVTMVAYYSKLMTQTQLNPENLTDFETEIIMDKLDKNQVLKHKPLRNLNLNFKLRIITFMGVIVGLQNNPYECVVLIALIQIFSLFSLLRKMCKFSKIFSGKLDAFTFIMTELTILIFVLVCLVIYGEENDLNKYITGEKEYTFTSREKFANYGFIGCLCLTILGEFLLALGQLLSSLISMVLPKKKFTPASQIWKRRADKRKLVIMPSYNN